MDKLTRFPSSDPVSKVQRNINKLFDDISAIKWFEDQGVKGSEIFAPKSDITESNDTYIIQADLPGILKNDITITLKDNCIVISGERKQESKHKTSEFIRHELQFGKFYRSYTLPDVGPLDKISATMKDGILTITIPKSEEKKVKEIKIQ